MEDFLPDNFSNEDVEIDFREREFFQKIPLVSPKRAFYLLSKKGYKGQTMARKSICLAAYRHVKRVKQIYLEKIPRENLPPKNNILLVGPTGCGKTYLVELLFQHILKLPTVIVDITGFSETGYIGEDTKTVLTRLLLAAGSNPIIASSGIVCLDEFDKLASSQNTVRFDGQGSTKDVSGYGVQRELLKMLEASNMEIPTDFDNSLYSTKQKMFTGDLTFIACGAFSSLKSSIFFHDTSPKIGFLEKKKATSRDENIAYLLSEGEVNDITNFQNYGFIPELIGRFTRLVPMNPLDKNTLKSILVDNIVKKFQVEFVTEGLDLEIKEEVMDYIVEKSYERQTGARGLGSLLTQHLEEAAFESFCGPRKTILLELQDEKIVVHSKSAKKYGHSS